MSKQNDWYALHCFLSDADALERFLLEAVLPEMDRLQAEQLMQRWFYIRYDEGGHHLRVRMGELPESEYGAVTGRLQDTLRQYLPQPDAAPRRPWASSPHGEGSVLAVAYEPETVRYGGPHAMPVSEKLFAISSRLAAQILRKAGSGLPPRLAVAADLMTACVAGQDMLHEEAIRFFTSYATYWEQFLVQRKAPAMTDEQAPTRYAERYAGFMADLALPGQPPRSLAAAWARAIRETVRTYRELGQAGLLFSPVKRSIALTDADITEAITSVMASQTHMMNNRLGVTPALEYKLARLLARSAIDALAQARGKAA